MKDRLVVILLFLNLFVGCGKLMETKATGGYELVNLYGYSCITNYSSIWCF